MAEWNVLDDHCPDPSIVSIVKILINYVRILFNRVKIVRLNSLFVSYQQRFLFMLEKKIQRFAHIF